MTDKCPKCGTVTEGIGGVSVAFRSGNGGPPVKPALMPHQFKCGACGHEWERMPKRRGVGARIRCDVSRQQIRLKG